LSRLKRFIPREQVHGHGGQHQGDDQPGAPVFVQLGARATLMVFAVVVSLMVVVLRHASGARDLIEEVAVFEDKFTQRAQLAAALRNGPLRLSTRASNAILLQTTAR
jgi:hypothetical protein